MRKTKQTFDDGLKNSFVECNLKLHMDKLVHLALVFAIQREMVTTVDGMRLLQTD